MEQNEKQPILLGEETKTGEKPKGEKKKIQNLISAIIILAGLFVGSLFVDVAQMVKGKGFSQKVLDKVDVVQQEGKTWVAYTDPVVNVKVVSDEGCEECAPDEALVWLRRVIPTILPEKVDVNSEKGKNLLENAGVKFIPAFIFSKEITETDIFQQAAVLFEEKDEMFVLRAEEIGLPIGKYVEAPEVSDDDIQIGNKNAKVKVIEFSDFQCPYCRAYHTSTINKVIEEFGDQILFVYKHLPLDFHAQAENAALAAECANEQGKFMAYANSLFENQNDWGESEGTQSFKTMATRAGLNGVQFNGCLDEKKYADKIEKDKEQASLFGVSGTPATFINDQFKSGVVEFEDLKKTIEEELQK